MGYVKDIERLIGALTNDVITPQAAMSGLEGLDDQRQERRSSRLAAQQAAQMQSLLGGAAAQGVPVDDVLLNASRTQKLTGAPPSMDLLMSLLSGAAQGPAQETDHFETSPLLDMDDRRSITQLAQQSIQAGKPINEIRFQIHNQFKTADPIGYKQVADTIDELIKRAVSG